MVGTDKLSGIQSGPYGTEAIVINKIASASLVIGAIVGNATAGTGEFDTRTNVTTTTTATLTGVVVGGDSRPVYDTGGTNNTAASGAGKGVQVCVFGRCKVAVNGSVGTILAGDPICNDPNNNGYGIKGTAGTSFILGYALQGSTAFGDYILMDVNRVGI